jgi:upstream activation factor subunit UAF30
VSEDFARKKDHPGEQPGRRFAAMERERRVPGPFSHSYSHCKWLCTRATLQRDASSVLKGDLMAKTVKKKTARKANAAFMRPMNISPDLAEVIGPKAIPRTEVTKKLWLYIKKHALQDPKNKRNINADPALKKVFGGKGTVSMFEMTKLVGKHLK